ncbi:MAG: hypothetical protein JWN25_2072 [Verrucomicrobiales bacterium]|nr:hypothetical protein [Verrucomicrobiales bacterium]MDB6131037.1 hypothetical protein [Verrucomicrobiales bacterium]
MKQLTPLLVCLSLTFAACQKEESKPAPTAAEQAKAFNNAISNNSSGNPVAAPANYLGALAKGQQSAIKTIDSTSLNKAVELFYAQEGRYPKDLQELVANKYIGEVPKAPIGMQINYDPKTGKVNVVNQ